ncbi:COesterase domain-containing protein [Mycena chlorophos]|uniref:Carboxylic ester hydrolase n=1 Tax=Mycena chlorophos TaxID=658473 RepID=A0A8H6S721_MYCCL|nr:COesterase domain-containing protein [Mycena chlorophos]
MRNDTDSSQLDSKTCRRACLENPAEAVHNEEEVDVPASLDPHSDAMKARVLPFLALLADVVASGPIVDLGAAGQWEGFINPEYNVSTFLGIRYAAPPTGNLRWQFPTAPVPVQGIQPATSQPPMCYQGSQGTNATGTTVLTRRDTVAESEDCLFLKCVRIFTFINAEETSSDTGYDAGAASWYNGTDLVVESNNTFVVVVIQYRLGLFGFLAGQQVHDHGVANAALWDQQFALRWVHDNVEKFGGDPDHVTIWGESAGAGSVFQHLVANGGKTKPQLFRAAITSSTFAAIQYPYNHWVPQGLFDTIADLANCTNATKLDCLRAVDAETLSSINLEVGRAAFYGIPAFLPVVDGTFVAESPLIQLAKGDVNGQYYLGITNTNEGTIFIDAEGNYTVAGWLRNIMPAFSIEQSEEIAEVYEALGGTAFDQIEILLTEAGFVCPTQYLLSNFPHASYKGQFAIPPAWHGNDLPYYFPDLVDLNIGVPAPWNNTAFTDAFVGGLFAFAANYDPNKELAATILPEWPLWSADADAFMVFNQTDSDAMLTPAIGVQKLENAVLQRCEMWRTWRLETSQ